MLTFRTRNNVDNLFGRQSVWTRKKNNIWSLETSFQNVFHSLTSTPNGAQLVVVEGLRGDENQ